MTPIQPFALKLTCALKTTWHFQPKLLLPNGGRKTGSTVQAILGFF